ncbi:ATPase [Hylemonella gracilis str. Niagara R]|uniref:Sensor protein n=1 Tax=Hylemonella gracilis str. Niagara R TaxID=1458275 RepID=A0A016XJC1_9BURK|nr:heavy metal sensor histidine kinase [Hylemonella gracilis]EYC52184.1 ATPase [Hylemonella gracilis str. Niagara R]
MFQSLSLTSRLTIFFTLVAAVVVLGLGAILHIATERHFVELDHMALKDKRHLIEEILESSRSVEDSTRRLSEALGSHHGLFALITDGQGKVIFRSEGFRPPQSTDQKLNSYGAESYLYWRDAQQEFHGQTFQVMPAYRPSVAAQVMVALDSEHHTQFMSELRQTLLIYAMLATMVSGLLGWLAAHHGMAPLRAMKSRASNVTGQKLNQRMSVDAVPVEMADLAHELNQMLDRLQKDFQRLSDFSSDLAHELRTPISNLMTQTQVALSSRRNAETYRDILASNAEEFQRLAKMVSDMLFLAKTERGVDLPHKESFLAAQEVQTLIEFYDAVADEKDIQLELRGDGEIVGDRLMFRRAVSNLLSNALRHADRGTSVVIGITQIDGYTQVEVSNTGDEIDPNALPRLFDRFYRAAPARNRPETEGAGLGLSITRAIVEAHGGHVLAHSSSRSTKFVMNFPLS